MTQNEAETVQEYVTRIIKEKNLSTYDVERNSGGAIKQSYVSKVVNGYLTDLPVSKLQSLALGLKVDEEELIAIARGQKISNEDLERIELEAMYRKGRKLSPARKDTFRRILDMVDRELDRLYEEELTLSNQTEAVMV